jgi:putative SOS response-associated peptidase YedK
MFSSDELLDIQEMLREIQERVNTRIEVRPTDFAPILIPASPRVERPRPLTKRVRWGFPGFKGSAVVINARSETAEIKPMFSSSLKHRRCIIPATGFFEWTGEKTNKVKHLIKAVEAPLMFFAGCYNDFRIKETLETRFVILTTAANSFISEIHDRMPLILQEDQVTDWLLGKKVEYFVDMSKVLLEHRIEGD